MRPRTPGPRARLSRNEGPGVFAPEALGYKATPRMRDFMSRVPRLHADVGVQRVGGRLMAAGPGDELHTFEDEHGEVSEVGERILELIDGSKTVAQIVESLLEEFDVERPVCEEDTRAFIQLLEDRHVIVLG